MQGDSKDVKMDYRIARKPSRRSSVASFHKNKLIEPVPFHQLFRFATRSDMILTCTSAVLGILCGCVPPCLSLLLGNMMNSLNLKDQDSFNSAVNQVSTFMLMLGCISAFLSYTYTTCGMISAENQAIRLRKEYFKALLRQDMSWIDVNQPGEAASRLAEDTVTFQVQGICGCLIAALCKSHAIKCADGHRGAALHALLLHGPVHRRHRDRLLQATPHPPRRADIRGRGK